MFIDINQHIIMISEGSCDRIIVF